MNIEAERMAVPEDDDGVPPAATVRMPSKDYARLCRDLGVLGDSVRVSADAAGDAAGDDAGHAGHAACPRVRFQTAGDIGSASITYGDHPAGADGGDGTTVAVTSPVSIAVSLRYMAAFAKAAALSSHAQLALDPGRPLVVSYAITGDVGSVKFYLAPKLSDEDDEEGDSDVDAAGDA
jgi:proliferating cell nuclear antigen